jgi:large subunit ribosomal protein L10
MRREEKTAVVEEIASQIDEAQAIYAVDYIGITVAQAAALRSSLRDADASFRVVKNTLTLLAADKAGEPQVKELVVGPTAFTFVHGDPALAAKALDSFARQEDVLEVRGGLMDGVLIDADAFKRLARLPGRDQLNAQLAGVVASPLTGLARGLNALLSGIAIALGALQEKKAAEGPDEPSAAAEPPKEETPAAGKAPAAEEAGEAPAEEAPATEAEAEPHEAPATEEQAEQPEAGGEEQAGQEDTQAEEKEADQ